MKSTQVCYADGGAFVDIVHHSFLLRPHGNGFAQINRKIIATYLLRTRSPPTRRNNCVVNRAQTSRCTSGVPMFNLQTST